MTAKPEPAMVHSELSETEPYKQAMLDAGSTPVTLNLGWYNPFMNLDGHGDRAHGDISFMNHVVAEEVKTPGDAGASMFDGRLESFKWHSFLLRDVASSIEGFCFIIRDLGEGLDQKAEKSFDSACEWLARNQTRWNFHVNMARTNKMVPRVARSFMREFEDPQPRTMPPPVIKKELLEWPFGVQVLCMIDGWYIELSKQMLSKRSFWTIAIDAHDMEKQAFIDEYNQVYNFGGKKATRLTSLWTAFHFEELFDEKPIEAVMTLQDPAKFIKLHEAIKNKTGT